MPIPDPEGVSYGWGIRRDGAPVGPVEQVNQVLQLCLEKEFVLTHLCEQPGAFGFSFGLRGIVDRRDRYEHHQDQAEDAAVDQPCTRQWVTY